MVLSYGDYADLMGKPDEEDPDERRTREERERQGRNWQLAEEQERKRRIWEARVDALWRVHGWREGVTLAYPETVEALEAIIADHGLSGLVIEPRNQKWLH
jgi:hypothetical protein